MESQGGYLYGSSDTNFDLISFLKKPSVFIKIIGIIFSIVVFGCIATNVNGAGCPYVAAGACGFGTAIGVVAFLALVAFLVIEATFENIVNLDNRRYALISELTFSALWSFMWFVCFCYMADTWRRQTKTIYSTSNAQAAIAFSFFSIFVFLALTLLAVARYRRGDIDDFLPSSEPGPADVYNQDNTGYYQFNTPPSNDPTPVP